MQAQSYDVPATARLLRAKIVAMCSAAKAAHVGSALSCVDILAAAYFDVLRIDPDNPRDPGRDRFILSKGHAAPALYAALALRGFFPQDTLDGYAQAGCPLEEHPGPLCAPGVEAGTGSLGHGLPIGAGMALAARINRLPYRVYVLASDGELNEGSVWEAAMFASGRKLANLTCLVDFNKWQATGRSCQVMGLEPLAAKWESFGWRCLEIDGHDTAAIAAAMRLPPDPSGAPLAVVAHTVKGKGVSFMEDDNNWHYRVPSAADVARANKELGLA